MAIINRDYLFTEFYKYNEICGYNLLDDSLYFFEQDTEARSIHCSNELRNNNPKTQFIGIIESKDDIIELVKDGQQIDSLSLHSGISIHTVLRKMQATCVYLDVTGMNCRVAAPILKVMLEENIPGKVVYAEPYDYLLEEFQKEGLHKDWSEMVDGVNPLPGFVNLIPYDDPPVFVSLLGFEGGRFAYLVSDQNPLDKSIRPIVGVPGYKMNYPYISLWGNRKVLTQRRCWNRIEYAEANSIVDIYDKLDQIFNSSHKNRMMVAPIGTKPHAIGAIIYAIKHPKEVEILYDNPKRTLHRTEGVGRISICDVTKLFNS